MKPSRFFIGLLALLLALPVLARATQITPSDPDSTMPVVLHVVDGAPTDGCDVANSTAPVVSRQGSLIQVVYALRRLDPAEVPPGSVCYSTLVPARFPVDLGRLPAGEYEVSITGTFDGVAREPQSITFAVRALDQVFIPSNAPWALSLMLMVLGGFAAWRLRARA